MKLRLQILFLFILTCSYGQVGDKYAIIDKKVAKIPDSLNQNTSKIAAFITNNFSTENDKIRAVFFWTASNISYDVPNMYEPNQFDSSQEKIVKSLKSKKGVCIHYAEIFNEIANKVGLQSYVIVGYTKQNGKVSTIAHAWCASKIDGVWFLFDPTWGSGYVQGEKFYKKLNNSFFKVAPNKMILSHMPFDYLWQFLNNPFSNQEFYDGKTDALKDSVTFDYQKEIAKYLNLPEEEKAFDTAERVEKKGILNNLILEYYNYKRKEFNTIRQNKNIEKIKEIVIDYNQGIDLLNDFIMYRNKKFKPPFSDEIIKEMIKTAKDKLEKCLKEVYNIGSIGSENSSNLNALKKSLIEATDQAKVQDDFVKEYISKGKGERKNIFRTVSWLGMPLR